MCPDDVSLETMCERDPFTFTVENALHQMFREIILISVRNTLNNNQFYCDNANLVNFFSVPFYFIINRLIFSTLCHRNTTKTHESL